MDKIFNIHKVKSIIELKNLIINSGKIHKKGGALAVRVLLNYSEQNDLMDIDEIEKYRKRIKIHNEVHIDKFIPNDEQIITSLKYLSENVDRKYLLIYHFMIQTSCRYTEAVNFFDKFDEKLFEVKDNICAYANFFLRGKKTSFYLLFTKSLYDELKPLMKSITKEDLNFLKRKSHREDVMICLKYLRKYSFTKMVMSEMPVEVANMVSGRSQKSNVGITHYLNQKEIMLKEYQKVVPIYEELFKDNVLTQ